MDVTIKKYFEDSRFWCSKFSWNIEWDRRLSFHSFNFATFIDCYPYPSGGPPSEELWVYPACFPETAAGFETHYNPDDVHIDNVANQCRQAKVKKSLHRPTHQPPLPPKGIFLVLISVRFWEEPRALVRREELSHWKNKMAPSGIFLFRKVLSLPPEESNYNTSLSPSLSLLLTIPPILWRLTTYFILT